MKLQRLSRCIAVATIVCCFASGVHGQTFDVKGLDISKGSVEVGLDNSIMSSGSDNRSAHDQSIDYGVREWWRLSAVMKLENPATDEPRASRAAVENIFVLRSMKAEHDVGLGFFAALEASINSDTAHAFVFGPIITKKWGQIIVALNPFLEQTFGHNRVEGIALSYGWQAKYEVRDGLAVGIEGYGLVENLGNSPALADQEHRIGPAIFTEIELTKGFKITPDIGLLFGLTPSTPDIAFKFNIGVPLHQR